MRIDPDREWQVDGMPVELGMPSGRGWLSKKQVRCHRAVAFVPVFFGPGRGTWKRDQQQLPG